MAPKKDMCMCPPNAFKKRNKGHDYWQANALPTELFWAGVYIGHDFPHILQKNIEKYHKHRHGRSDVVVDVIVFRVYHVC